MMRKFYCLMMAVVAVTFLHAQTGDNKFIWLDDEGAFFEVNAFSDNQAYAVGRGSGKAFIYNLKTGSFTYLTEEGQMSNAWDVSDDGVVVGCSGEDMTSEACYWDKDGKMTLLAPDYEKWTTANGITPTGNLIVGFSSNKEEDPEPFVSHAFYWLLESDQTYKMEPLQEITEEAFGEPLNGMFTRGVAADGTILASIQAESGEFPLVYYKSYSDQPVYFAKDSLKILNKDTWEYEGDQPFIACTGEEISENGNWICCTVSNLVEEAGFPAQYFYPSAYNIAENKFYTSDVVLQVEREPAGGVVDNNGNMFSTVASMDAMVGRTIVYIKKGETGSVKIDDYLKENGVESTPFEEVSSNTIMSVSGDGKLVGGFALRDYQTGWIFSADGILTDPVMPTSITNVSHAIGLNCYLSGTTLRLGNEVKEVILFTASGEQVVNTTANSNGIDLSGLNRGVYLVKLIADGATSISKILVK